MQFNELDLLYGEDYCVNDYITIRHPTVRDVKKYNEEKYFSLVSAFISTPSDYKVQLYDMGINYSNLDEFEFFCSMKDRFAELDTSILFKDFQFGELVVGQRNDSEDILLYNEKTKAILDNYAYKVIVEYLCKMNCLEKSHGKPANDEYLKYAVELERSKQRRNKNKQFKSIIKPYIVTLVNCKEFKYDYTTVLDLPIYTFHESARQIPSNKFYDGLICGIYSGNVMASKLSKDELNFIKN